MCVAGVGKKEEMLSEVVIPSALARKPGSGYLSGHGRQRTLVICPLIN